MMNGQLLVNSFSWWSNLSLKLLVSLIGLVLLTSYQAQLGNPLYFNDLSDHALYIGVIKIEHQEDTALTTMDIKVFSDDLQNALKNEFGWKELPNISIACEEHTDVLLQYFQNHLSLFINNKPVSLALQTCKNDSEVYILRYTFAAAKKWTSLTLQADFLMELFPTQSNVLQVQYQVTGSAGTTQPYFGRMTKGKERVYFDMKD